MTKRLCTTSKCVAGIKKQRRTPTSSDPQATVISHLEDRISHLPDDILINIISLMTTKEATLTSILSKSWRYLWQFIPCLQFGSPDIQAKLYGELYVYRDSCTAERQKFVHWVDHVVKSHRWPAVEDFRIVFGLDSRHKQHIDSCLSFVLSKKIKRLVLDLSPCDRNIGTPEINYTFPVDFLTPVMGSSSGVSTIYSCTSSHRSLVSLTSLRVLTLKSVNVTQEVLEFFIYNCSFLEELSVYGTLHLVNVKVVGPALKLKHLSLAYCLGIERVEICDTSITSFLFNGPKIVLLLENCPDLVDVSVKLGLSASINYAFSHMSCCFSQLERLSFRVFDDEEYLFPGTFPQLKALKQLVIELDVSGDSSLLKLTHLIEVAPHMQNFVLRSNWMEPSIVERQVMTVTKHHHHLKVVELAGYYGRTSDFELAMYFIQNALVLERLIVKPKCQFSNLPITEYYEIEQANARIRAMEQLEKIVPPTVDLLIP